MSDPSTWELTAYGRLYPGNGHYARRRSDDKVERHYDKDAPCECPNRDEFGPALPRGVHHITIECTVRVQIRNGKGDVILYEDSFRMPWDASPMDVTWQADNNADGSRALFE